MNRLQDQTRDTDRMLQEAEFYETQGLFDHAVLVYQAVLDKDPQNLKAQSRLVQLKFDQEVGGDSATAAMTGEDLSPRLALDLGLAYMGMNLYAEALEQFRKPLKSSPTIRNELLRYIAVCLIRLHKHKSADKVIAKLLADPDLSFEEKGDLVEETGSIFVEEGQLDRAVNMLEDLPNEIKKYVKDYDLVLERLSSPTARQRFEVVVEDTETGETFTERIELDPVELESLKMSQGVGTEPETIVHPPKEQSPAADKAEKAPDLFSTLEERALKALETQVLSEFPSEAGFVTPAPTPSKKGSKKDMTLTIPADNVTRVRFACECGQIHVVTAKNMGRKGKCGNCGKPMEVPLADTRPDSLTETVVGSLVGGCRILHKIGGGGMGGVFKGHHVALDIAVAVKILHAHLADKDPIFVKRFIREARAAAKLQHPNIVGVMNVGFENGLHFLVMPYVGGGSAALMLAKVGRFPVDRVLRIGLEISSALVVAEENNILHRDVKPANILFTTRGEAMLADLGLAKSYMDAQDSGITQTGIACGTPLYFSPEQAKGAANLDIRSDIYSLGITMYHLLNGSPPFKGESAYVIFQKHVHEPLPPFGDLTPPVPESVFRLLLKMTAKNPDDRFRSAEELRVAIENLREELARAEKEKGAKPVKKGLLERLGLKRSY